jgi:hypothetical protein
VLLQVVDFIVPPLDGVWPIIGLSHTYLTLCTYHISHHSAANQVWTWIDDFHLVLEIAR